jgi:small-conductance mechanosensitive channel
MSMDVNPTLREAYYTLVRQQKKIEQLTQMTDQMRAGLAEYRKQKLQLPEVLKENEQLKRDLSHVVNAYNTLALAAGPEILAKVKENARG